ncbi:hypothetical protein Scep_024325 [Stephania cephalantha]|uniref:Uncharacterized protein n=1 Tax=Stephania cephalantha TaxID=152367 RepID=A0AAP0EZ37_9MAGN
MPVIENLPNCEPNTSFPPKNLARIDRLAMLRSFAKRNHPLGVSFPQQQWSVVLGVQVPLRLEFLVDGPILWAWIGPTALVGFGLNAGPTPVDTRGETHTSVHSHPPIYESQSGHDCAKARAHYVCVSVYVCVFSNGRRRDNDGAI